MQMILIADASHSIADALSASLSDSYNVYTCNNPADLLPLLESLQPRAVIINAAFLGISGLLQISKAAFCPQNLIILTNLITDQLLETAHAIHASHLSLMPFSMHAFKCKLQDLLGE